MPKLALLLFLSLFLLPSSAQAAGQVKTDTEVTYRFDDTGQAEVTHQVTLTNLVSQIYTTSYTLSVHGQGIQNLTASDHTGELPVSVTQIAPDQSAVNLHFSDPVAGKNKSHTFTLSYSGSFATKNGQVWDVTLPKFALPEPTDSYILTLFIPQSFGLPAFISPPPTDAQPFGDTSGYTRYSFSSPHAASGIAAAFGDFQSLDFTLTYHLRNSSFFSKDSVVAIPPDTSYQRLFYDSIEPSPHAVTQDADGNWLATFRLPGRHTSTVTLTGQAHILGQPSTALASPSAELLNLYLQPTALWPADDPTILRLAQALTTPRAIYDYVVATLRYDYTRLSPTVSRQGALWALAHPQSALCTDFTDLFIALARSAGIPAREIQGFALTDNPQLRPLSLLTDVLHAWPEYWDAASHTWRSIDPTWGQTTNGLDYFHKLDLAHFAFAIHGTDPQNPLPAGLYKLDSSSKDVTVTVGEYRDYFPAPLATTWNPPWQFLPLVNNQSSISITNPNGLAYYRLPVQLGATGLTLAGLPPADISILPPFASLSIPVTFRSSVFPPPSTRLLSVQVGSQAITYNISDYQFILWYAVIALTITSLIFALALLALKAGHLHFQKPRR